MALQDGGMDLATAKAKVIADEAAIAGLTPEEQYEATLKGDPWYRELQSALYRRNKLIIWKGLGRAHV